MADENYRRNQQDGQYTPKIWGGINGDVGTEWQIETVRFWDDANFYGILLREAPLRGAGLPTIIIARRVSLDPDDDIPLTEVDLENDPSTGEFSVDYEELGFDGTGRVFLPASAEGWTLVVKRYPGSGRVLKDEGDLVLEGDLTIGGNIVDPSGVALSGFITIGSDVFPVYLKRLGFTYSVGSTNVAHGIASAETDNKILEAWTVDHYTNMAQNYNVTAINWDDTNVNIAASVSPLRDAYLYIRYIGDALA